MSKDKPINNSLTRRQFLVGTGAVLTTVASGSLISGCSSNKKPSTLKNSVNKIDHVLIVMQENRSFDHYFGTLRGVNGFQNAIEHNEKVLYQDFTANTMSKPYGKLLPFHLNTLTQPVACISDINHSWGPQHKYWNGGRLDGFGPEHLIVDGADAGRNTMGYYERDDLEFHYFLADEFTICDAYHCSVLGPTHPNRVMSISGTLDPDGTKGGPVLSTRIDIGYEASASWTTMPERLQANGISWKFYETRGQAYQPGTSLGAITSDNPLLYFKQFLDSSSELYHNAFTPSWPDDFINDVQSNNLPQVSWINLPDVNQEHPPASPLAGAQEIEKLLSILLSNSKIWRKTALFITYDENGGFFDHVVPPTAPKGTPGEYIKSPLPAAAQSIDGPIGLGFRVPTFVISPYSRGGWVCGQTFDHTSTLRFLETRFGVEVPNLSEWRREVTGDLTSAFDFNSPDFSEVSLPEVPSQLPAIDSSSTCALNTVLGSEPTAQIPNPQSLPTQEPGTRPRRPI
jgi:phospholipase C